MDDGLLTVGEYVVSSPAGDDVSLVSDSDCCAYDKSIGSSPPSKVGRSISLSESRLPVVELNLDIILDVMRGVVGECSAGQKRRAIGRWRFVRCITDVSAG